MDNTMKMKDHALIGALHETTSRYGSAAAESLKGLRGIDNETGQVFDRGLQKIAGYKINPEYAERNIKQQAGYSAEVVSVSKRNARAIIDGDKSRFSRSEDFIRDGIKKYGKNHKVADIVELIDDREVISQMKFVTNSENLLKKIACGEGGGKSDLSRYMSIDKLEVPTEQVEVMKKHCRDKVEKLQEQIDKNKELGKWDIVEKKIRQRDNYQKLEKKITDSGLTTEEAIQYRLNPKMKTAIDMGKVSHESGIQGAKFGMAIGGTISIVCNMIAVCSGNKAFGEAVLESGKDTLIATGVGYSTAFSGAFIKSYMQQAGSQSLRHLSKTGLPAAIVSVCIAAGKSIHKYAEGTIDEAQLAQEMGLTASGLLSASMFTMLGQIAVPIPVLGGMIGGMVGYAITNNFYQSFADVLKERKVSAERLQILEMQCAAAKAIANAYRMALEEIFSQKIAQLDAASMQLFAALGRDDISAEEFCTGINQFAEVLGKKLSINNLAELDSAMASDDPLTI